MLIKPIKYWLALSLPLQRTSFVDFEMENMANSSTNMVNNVKVSSNKQRSNFFFVSAFKKTKIHTQLWISAFDGFYLHNLVDTFDLSSVRPTFLPFDMAKIVRRFTTKGHPNGIASTNICPRLSTENCPRLRRQFHSATAIISKWNIPKEISSCVASCWFIWSYRQSVVNRSDTYVQTSSHTQRQRSKKKYWIERCSSRCHMLHRSNDNTVMLWLAASMHCFHCCLKFMFTGLMISSI